MGMNKAQFANKVAIVTGAANGIGRAIGQAFARAGARLCLFDIESELLQEAAQECEQIGAAGVLTHEVDVTDLGAVTDTVRHTASTYGQIDILINNAGIMMPPGLVEDTDNDIWLKTFQVNVMGVINGCRAAIPTMKQQRSGRIINAASMYGITPQVLRGPYCVSKAAIITLTRVLAAELGPYGITVNAYAPGTAQTRMSSDAVTGERAVKKMQEIPLGRFGELDEVASTVLFLASSEAQYINGITLPIDGGRLAVQNPERIWAIVPDEIAS
jgi:3-oxoacyl-[acyl-carrier protein] reductase